MNRSPLSTLLFAFLAGALLVLPGCSSKPSQEAAPPSTETAALPADVAEVAAELSSKLTPDSGAAAENVEPDGTIAATGELVSPVRSELVVRTPGRVAVIHVEEGASVRRGQPLLELETQYLKPELEWGQAELLRVRAAAAEAKADFERKQQLFDKGAIPQSLYDRSRGGYEQAQAAVAAAAAAVALAQQKLADAVLTSPITGVVAERRADVGERLGDNTVAYVLVQVAPLKLRFELPERYLPRVIRGQKVSAQVDPYPGVEFSGKLTMVGRVIDAASRTFPVEAELPNGDGRLAPGMFARVSLAAEQGGARE